MRNLDFGLRLVFFATVPFLATRLSALFPMTGVLVNIALALVVLVFAEALRDRARGSRVLTLLVGRQLELEAHYRRRPPGPFLYYVFSPLLFPYWLVERDARREMFLHRGLTGGGLVVLAVAAVIDYFRSFRPELSVSDFLTIWAILFAVQTVCLLVFLLPIVTTVVKLHLERRRRALWFLIGVAVVSAGVAVVGLVDRRAPVVSWVTTERAILRTRARPDVARAVQLAALRVVWAHPQELLDSTDNRGWVEDDALDRAEEALETFYRADEAYGFSLHALPPRAPEVLLLQFHLGRGRPSLWRAVRKSGEEILSVDELPPGVLGLARRATRKPPTRRAPFRQLRQ